MPGWTPSSASCLLSASSTPSWTRWGRDRPGMRRRGVLERPRAEPARPMLLSPQGHARPDLHLHRHFTGMEAERCKGAQAHGGSTADGAARGGAGARNQQARVAQREKVREALLAGRTGGLVVGGKDVVDGGGMCRLEWTTTCAVEASCASDRDLSASPPAPSRDPPLPCRKALLDEGLLPRP